MKNSPVKRMLDELADRYTDSYVSNRRFRLAIEASYPLGITTCIGMDALSYVSPALYRAAAKSVLRNYMLKLLQASGQPIDQMNQEMQQQEQRHEQARQQAEREHRSAASEASQAESKRAKVEQYLKDQIEGIHGKKQIEIQQSKERKRQKAQKGFEKEVRETLKSSGLMREEKGRLLYNNDVLVDRLSELFADDILERAGTDVESGYRAMLSGSSGVDFTRRGRTKPTLPARGVDWAATKRASLEAGRDGIEEEDLVVRYPSAERPVCGVIALDISHSMVMRNPDHTSVRDFPEKFMIAKKTALALGSMLRRIGKRNEVVHIAFAERPRIVGASRLYATGTEGGTDIGSALDLSRAALRDRPSKGIGVVYLITDCSLRDSGHTLESVLRAARLYADERDYYLRLFFIEPDSETTKVARELTGMSGRNSRVVPVEIKDLDVAAAEDFVELFRGIYRSNEI